MITNDFQLNEIYRDQCDEDSKILLLELLRTTNAENSGLILEDLLENWTKMYLEDEEFSQALKVCNETVEMARKKLRDFVSKDQKLYQVPSEVLEKAN